MITLKYISDTPSRHHRDTSPAYHWMNSYERMSQGDNKWNDLQFIDPSNKFADYYVIINHPYMPHKRGAKYNSAMDYFEPDKTILIHIEPALVRCTGWGEYRNPENLDLMKVLTMKTGGVFGRWWVDLSYNELKTLTYDKKDIITCVSTGKDHHYGHKHRLRVIEEILDKRNDAILYGKVMEGWGGNNIIENSPIYQGELPHRNKNKALIDVKYHFCCENSSEDNYFTEKLVDPLVCETLPLYWGCPNLSEFIPKDSFIRLPLDTSLAKAKDIINSTIKNNEWADRLPYIKEAKRILLEELNLFPLLEKIINEKK